MAKLIGSSLFTGAISGLNSNFLLMLNGGSGLTLDNLLNPSSDNIKYTVNQSFRSYMMNNFNQIDIDGDGTISQEDLPETGENYIIIKILIGLAIFSIIITFIIKKRMKN